MSCRMMVDICGQFWGALSRPGWGYTPRRAEGILNRPPAARFAAGRSAHEPVFFRVGIGGLGGPSGKISPPKSGTGFSIPPCQASMVAIS